MVQVQNSTFLNLSFFLAFIRLLHAFDGEATYYGGAGGGGSCSSTYVPDGFKTVAMNNAQYQNGWACGSCVEGCFDLNGQQECFKAIVDNLCPECAYGDLDMGWSGDGRWPLQWEFIECPYNDPIITTQGSNSFYGKVKIEGVGPIDAVQINGVEATPTPDGYWVVNDSSGSLGCGPKLTAQAANGRSLAQCLDGSLFGGGCSGGSSCTGGGNTYTAPSPNNASTNNVSNNNSQSNNNSNYVPPQNNAVSSFNEVTTTSNKKKGGSKSRDVYFPTDVDVLSNSNVYIPPQNNEVSSFNNASTTSNKKKAGGKSHDVYNPNNTEISSNNNIYVPPENDSDKPPSTNSGSSNYAGAFCENGILSADGLTCCPMSCGTCGGVQCSSRKGGANECCSSQIRVHYRRLCDSNAPPCLMN